MSDINKNLEELINNDTLSFDVDPSIILRLKNHQRASTLRSSVRMNSFFPSGLKNIRPLSGIRVGIACCLLFAMLAYKHINTNNTILINCDTTLVSTSIDTTHVFPCIDTVQTKL